jgi:hypothetical protein
MRLSSLRSADLSSYAPNASIRAYLGVSGLSALGILACAHVDVTHGTSLERSETMKTCTKTSVSRAPEQRRKSLFSRENEAPRQLTNALTAALKKPP